MATYPETFPALVDNINLHLGDITGGQWVTRDLENYDRLRMNSVDGPDGMNLNIALLWNNESRLRIYGVFPSDHRGYSYLPHNEKPKEITIAIERGAPAIAKDIAKRLLPWYSKLLARAQIKCQQAETQQAGRVKLQCELAEALGTEVHSGFGSEELRVGVPSILVGEREWYNSVKQRTDTMPIYLGGVAKVGYDGMIEMDLNHLSPELAFAIAKLLKDKHHEMSELRQSES